MGWPEVRRKIKWVFGWFLAAVSPTVEHRMAYFCNECLWCNLPSGIGSNRDGSTRYPGCTEVGADCGYYRTCEGPDGCLVEYKRLRELG